MVRHTSAHRSLIPLPQGFFCLFLLATATGAHGQRLFDFAGVLDTPVTAGERVDAFAVQVDLGFLRSVPQRVELPTPDGRILVAELSVFEGGDNGDFMWAGSLPGAGYESIVFTVRGGRLVGLVEELDGANLRITTDPTGGGRMVDTAQFRADPQDPMCTAGVIPESRLLAPAVEPSPADPPQMVAEESNTNLLDILAVYTPGAKDAWSSGGTTPETALQAAVDYLNMVFRNGALSVNARLVHIEEASAALNRTQHTRRDLHELLADLKEDRRVQALRAEHGADIVHLFAHSVGTTGCRGVASVLPKFAQRPVSSPPTPTA